MQVIVCPGQGAQRPGMLQGWRQLPGASELLERYSVAAGLDLVRLGTEADAATIANTAIAQPLIVATELLSYRLAEQSPHRWWSVGNRPNRDASSTLLNRRCEPGEPLPMVAGHSVGMLAAYAIAGAYDDETAIKLAAARGRVFQQVASSLEMGMSAVIGKGVLQRFSESEWGKASGLDVAVVNSDSQIVVAGHELQLAEFASSAPAGTRVTPLAVSGAFHTKAMQPAVKPFATMLQQLDIRDPQIQVINDLTGQPFTGGKFGFGSADNIVQHLSAQITNPVRWDLVMNTLRNVLGYLTDAASPLLGRLDIVELAPSGTLTALLKRSLPNGVPLGLSNASLVTELDL